MLGDRQGGEAVKGLTIKVEATVILTGREWQVFSPETMASDGSMTLAEAKRRHGLCVSALNRAASEALSCGDERRALRIWDEATARWEHWGAGDSEPQYKFEQMWQKVYGEDD